MSRSAAGDLECLHGRLFMSVADAARFLGADERSVRRGIDAGVIPAVRVADRTVRIQVLPFLRDVAGLTPEQLRRVGIYADTGQVDGDDSGSDSQHREPDPDDRPAPTGSPGNHDTSSTAHTTLRSVNGR